MRHDRRLRSTTAFCLLALLGALGTGLPSHHHEDDPQPSDSLPHLYSADHHTHGTKLVGPDQRVPSATLEFAAPSALAYVVLAEAVVPERPPRSSTLRPMERAPPAVAPRAPPFPV